MQTKPVKKTLLNVLGVVYAHVKTSDGGDLYLTRFAEHYQEHLDTCNWYESSWFNKHKVRLEGTVPSTGCLQKRLTVKAWILL